MTNIVVGRYRIFHVEIVGKCTAGAALATGCIVGGHIADERRRRTAFLDVIVVSENIRDGTGDRIIPTVVICHF